MKLKEVLAVFDRRLAALEHSVNDVLIGSLQKASDEYIDEENYGKFCDSYGPSIEPLAGSMKILYGEDFDTSRNLYDALKKAEGYGSEDFDEKGLVEAKIQELQNKIAELQKVKNEEKSEGAEKSNDEEEIPSEEQLAREFIAVK